MTDKEKAIEAFDDVYDELYPKGWSVDCGKKLMIVKDYLLKPTLDDAIAVVEKMRENITDERHLTTPYDSLKMSICNEILTALRGLKEGK